jgi:hypothetical protein
MKNYEMIMVLGLSAIFLQAHLALQTVHAEENLFTALDLNKDQILSLKEAYANATLLKNFGQMDINEDGVISFAAYLAGPILKG